MRAALVVTALVHQSNRYALCRLAAKATRRLHRPNSRVQDTMNEALRHLALVPTILISQHESLPEIEQLYAA